LLDRLAKRGLVDRSREEKDRRVVTARITQAGLELLSSMDRTMRESPKQMLAGIGEKRLQSLLRLLRTVREKIA
jgi:DNA-binding MarR family transcriptional regulator